MVNSEFFFESIWMGIIKEIASILKVRSVFLWALEID
jgi:hypothetical protein